MASKIGDLYWKVDADTTSFNKGLKTTETKAKGLGTTFTKLGGAITTGFALAAVAGIASVSKELIAAASEAEETTNKFNVVFQEVADEAEAAGQRIKDEFKLSDTDTKAFLSQVGDITSGLGATSAEALLAAETITSLGLDIDSFANLSGGAEQAVSALTSLFTGEREAAKALGIVINDTNLKQYAEDTGKVYSELTQLEKGFLSLELAQTQSTLAIGDFARSIDSYANKTRIADAATEDLKVALGENLLSAATATKVALGGLTRGLADFVTQANTTKSALNDLRDGILNEELSLEELEATLERTIKLNQSASGQGRFKDEIIALEALIAAYGIQETFLTKEQGLQEATARAAADKLAAELAAAEATVLAQEEAEAALKSYLELVEGEYSKTQSGQIDALKEEISTWEEYAKTAVNTAPQIQAILDLKKQQLEVLTEENEELSENGLNLDAMALRYQAITDKLNGVGEVTEHVATLQEEWADTMEDRLASLVDTGIGSLLSSFGDLGEAFVEGELGWDSFAKAGLNAIAAVLDALGAQLAAQAASLVGAAFFSGGTSLAGLGPTLAGSAAAFAGAGVVRGIAGSFESGGVVPGPPSTGDQSLAAVNPGEEILREDDPRHAYNQNGGSTLILNVDGRKLAEAVIKPYVNTGLVTIDGKRGVR